MAIQSGARTLSAVIVGYINVDSVDISVGRDLFQEDMGITRVSNFTSRERYLHGTKATAKFS